MTVLTEPFVLLQRILLYVKLNRNYFFVILQEFVVVGSHRNKNLRDLEEPTPVSF